MKIKIKTNLIEIEIEDDVTLSGNYIKRDVPEITSCIETSIREAIRLHNDINQQ